MDILADSDTTGYEMRQSINAIDDDEAELLNNLPSEFRYPFITARDITLPPFRAKITQRN
jgi:hypothetical protein